MKNMKKICNLLCLLLIGITFVFTGVNPVNAAPTSTVIKQEKVSNALIGDKDDPNMNYSWAFYTTSDGNVAYCIDRTKDWPTAAGITMTRTGEADAGIKYILEHGYPYVSVGGQNDQEVDRYITQGAIWMYYGQFSDTFNSAPDPLGLREKMQALVNKARAASQSSTELNLNASSTNMTLSSDGKYYVSELTSSIAAKVSATGVDGVIVTDASGNKKSSFGAGEKILVKIPASSLKQTAKVNVTATAEISKAYVFTPADSKYQRTVSLYKEEVSKTVQLTATYKEKDKVCVDYVIVGTVKPDPAKTDPTPGKNCYDKGTKYDQEKELTTRVSNCKFNGWYTKSDLTGKWTNGTALNNDMTLYGAWDCGTPVKVPPTAANTPLIILGVGLVAIATGAGVYLYRDKKINSNK